MGSSQVNAKANSKLMEAEAQAVSEEMEEAENDEESSPTLRMSALSLSSKVRQLSRVMAEAKPHKRTGKKSKKSKPAKNNEENEEAEENEEEEEEEENEEFNENEEEEEEE